MSVCCVQWTLVPFFFLQFANELVRLNYNRVCVLHKGIDVLKATGMLTVAPADIWVMVTTSVPCWHLCKHLGNRCSKVTWYCWLSLVEICVFVTTLVPSWRLHDHLENSQVFQSHLVLLTVPCGNLCFCHCAGSSLCLCKHSENRVLQSHLALLTALVLHWFLCKHLENKCSKVTWHCWLSPVDWFCTGTCVNLALWTDCGTPPKKC